MKSILTLVREVDRGQLLEDLETALGEIANAIEKNGGSGQIALSLKFKKKGDAFLISGDFTHSTPKPPRIDSIFFFDGEVQEFTRRDPRQPQIAEVVTAEQINARRNKE